MGWVAVRLASGTWAGEPGLPVMSGAAGDAAKSLTPTGSLPEAAPSRCVHQARILCRSGCSCLVPLFPRSP